MKQQLRMKRQQLQTQRYNVAEALTN